ncbi:thiosulfate/3-mercaptopyruvate sulfurtransferase [Rhodococcus pyridinivorans]|uniref:sulfurtransferase n=1 Tax=Rhodococcus pyridinivorans TaxID=103816 RepID=UPI0007CD649E|nr:sulfurtransferase [Rhodococcus pyridinivorans]QXF80874.1 sulfurtransferase [Rhodococcus pyridinivorans]SED33474.1 thiosulfate/3-mercaptopyruvate sulfurtransferase [Rhodococcus pyridinivorans]
MSDTKPNTVSAEWLYEQLGDEDLVIVDATVHLSTPPDGAVHIEPGLATYLEEHIPGAVYADLFTDFSDHEAPQPFTAASSERFATAAGAVGIGEGRRVVLYDQKNGIWAARLWWQLRLEGGLPAWKAAGYPLSDEQVVPHGATFTSQHRPELVRSTEEIAASLDDPNTLIINALDPATYRGESPSYPRRGHIPGSINIPFGDLVDPSTGRLKPAAELREIFDKAGALNPDVKPVTYCGGGIAASGLAHALAAAGRSDVAVYDGSLNAWTADESLPLVEGPDPR